MHRIEQLGLENPGGVVQYSGPGKRRSPMMAWRSYPVIQSCETDNDDEIVQYQPQICALARLPLQW